MKGVLIFTNGCTRRKLDVERLKKYFRLNGYKITEKIKDTDLIIFVSCAFIKQREEESLKIIERLKNYKKELIVAGCLPEVARDRLDKIFNGKIISTRNLEDIDILFENFHWKFSKIPDANFVSSSLIELWFILKTKPLLKLLCMNYLNLIKNTIFDAIRSKLFFKKLSSIYFLRVNQGCLGNCSYCSIKKAIGVLKSKPLKICLEEYKQMVKKGYKNFVILGDDVGAYGLDIKISFPKLLKDLSKIDRNSLVKWSIKEMNPRWIIKYYSELLKFIKSKKISHMLCGIQSGSDRILKLMNRDPVSGEIKKILKEFKKMNPFLKLSAQIIIGFPSETEDDFLATLNLIKDVRFDEVFIYPYSKQEGVLSAHLENEISEEIKREKVKRMLDFLKKEKIKTYCEIL
jgi:tRNA A37 methylthiotransferase MiaB